MDQIESKQSSDLSKRDQMIAKLEAVSMAFVYILQLGPFAVSAGLTSLLVSFQFS